MIVIDQYRPNLMRLRMIAFDVGNEEDLLDAIREYSAALTRVKIGHTFEEFKGDHIYKVAERIETRMLPLFSSILIFQPPYYKSK